MVLDARRRARDHDAPCAAGQARGRVPRRLDVQQFKRKIVPVPPQPPVEPASPGGTCELDGQQDKALSGPENPQQATIPVGQKPAAGGGCEKRARAAVTNG